MGYLYEELIRKFSELSNETAGEHFTPREVIRLMVNLLFTDDDELLTRPGVVKTLLDPACGTGGMLSVAEDYLRELNPPARLYGAFEEGPPDQDLPQRVVRVPAHHRGATPAPALGGRCFPRWPVRWLRRAWLWSDRWQRVRPAGVSWNSRW